MSDVKVTNVEVINEEINEEVKESKCKKFITKTIDNVKAHPVKTILIVAGTVGAVIISVEVVKNIKSTPDIPELASDLVEDVFDNVDEVEVNAI